MKKVDNKQLISVLMPVHNAGDFLVEAIESIKWQTYPHWELIAVDDGSTDNSLAILKRFARKDSRIKVFHFKKNKGIAPALNYGLKKAKGQCLARMDADDVSLPRRFELELKYLKKHSRVVGAGSQIALIDENGHFLGSKSFPTQEKKLYDMMMTGVPIAHSGLMTYTRLLKKIRYENHDTDLYLSMLCKLSHYGAFANVDKVLLRNRVSKNSLAVKHPKKLYYLRLRSRIRALLQWGYKPSLKAIFLSFFQFVFISLTPQSLIILISSLFKTEKNSLKKVFRKKFAFGVR